jgi:phosphotransferase system enzyme I (PtsI)
MSSIVKQQEIVLKGIPASPGIAIGPVFLYRKQAPQIQEKTISPAEADQEIERLSQAVARSQKELRKILEFAQAKLGDQQSKIFEAQLMILEDTVLLQSIIERVRRELKNVEFVVNDEIGKYHRMMLAANDEYTRERAHDVEDVKNRILRNLQQEKLVSRLDGSYVVASHSLAAADTLIFSRNDVLGYAMEAGGVTSHSALLSRALKIPMVVGLREITTRLQHGDVMIVDGYNGMAIINPTDESIDEYEQRRSRYREFGQRLEALRDLPAETLDGRRIQLAANIELEEELDSLRQQGGDGIGLYRSEALLLGKEVFPSEDEQYDQYKRLVDASHPRPVIIRTFDIGGDKMMAHTGKENNPFLGWRGIRVMLAKEELFLDQLRAILRASTRKNVMMIFPMVSNIKEVREAKALVEVAKRDLREHNIPYDEEIKIGVMVEVPSAAVIADDLAKEVSFLSIGTNDLIQYLLAVDRSNDVVSDLYQEFHPAVIRFLRRIIERGRSKNVWVGMCGEMAGDPLATVLLVGLGLDEFSVIPSVLPEIKKIIRSIRYEDAKKVAHRVLSLQTEDEIKGYLKEYMRERFPEIPIE